MTAFRQWHSAEIGASENSNKVIEIDTKYESICVGHTGDIDFARHGERRSKSPRSRHQAHRDPRAGKGIVSAQIPMAGLVLRRRGTRTSSDRHTSPLIEARRNGEGCKSTPQRHRPVTQVLESPWGADAGGDKHCEEAVLVGRRRRSRENGRDEQRKKKTHRWLGVA